MTERQPGLISTLTRLVSTLSYGKCPHSIRGCDFKKRRACENGLSVRYNLPNRWVGLVETGMFR